MRLLFVGMLSLPMLANAAIYQCPGPNGQTQFSDRPCNGAAESPANRIEISPPPPSTPPQSAKSEAELEQEWEESRRFYYVELPAAERKAAELMASPDPRAQEIGREMAWQVQKGREAFEDLKRAREQRRATKERYEDAIREFGGY